MEQGTVKFFLPEKGYGFITPDDTNGGSGARDVFVHVSNVTPGVKLATGDKVTYLVEATKKGFNATNVSKA